MMAFQEKRGGPMVTESLECALKTTSSRLTMALRFPL